HAFVQQIDSGHPTGNGPVRLAVLLNGVAEILACVADDLSHRARHVKQQHTRTAGFRVAGESDVSERLLFCHRQHLLKLEIATLVNDGPAYVSDISWGWRAPARRRSQRWRSRRCGH